MTFWSLGIALQLKLNSVKLVVPFVWRSLDDNAQNQTPGNGHTNPLVGCFAETGSQT